MIIMSIDYDYIAIDQLIHCHKIVLRRNARLLSYASLEESVLEDEHQWLSKVNKDLETSLAIIDSRIANHRNPELPSLTIPSMAKIYAVDSDSTTALNCATSSSASGNATSSGD